MSTGTRQYPKDKSIQKEGGTTMKVWKKLATAVSMAAICCAMIVPTTANAQPCPQHVYTEEVVGQTVLAAEYDEHETSTGGICRVRWVRRHYIEKCRLCGQTGSEFSRDFFEHMNPSCRQ